MGETMPVIDRTNVLVVDDEVSVCQSVEKVLRRKGYQVAQALSVSAALDKLEAGEKYDMLVVDLMMPRVSGMELLKVVRERWTDVPVLIITGYASIASAVEATRNGAAGYLPKPFTPEELEAAVEQVLSTIPFEAAEAQETPQLETIDVDMPFDAAEVARATSPQYVEHLTRSDVSLVEHKPVPAADYCSLGQRSCKRMAKQGICKQEECPQIVAERKKAAKLGVVVSLVPDPIDVDMPFSRIEVVSMTSEAYVNALGRSDLPVVGFWRPEERAAALPSVLVVDDEPVVANSIRKILTRRAFRVQEAFSGSEALSYVSSGQFDLVLLDMRLPDANGLELISDIKKRKPNLRVVIVTGYASIDTAVEAIKRGASDYMAKPFTPEELYSTTSRVLERAVA